MIFQFYLSYIRSFQTNVFETKPVLGFNNDSLEFTLNSDSYYFFYNIIGVGVSSKGPVKQFCLNSRCIIPLVIGGKFSIKLFYKKRIVFNEEFYNPNLSINCSDEPWTNRICSFRDICYKNDKFFVTSPYSLIFEKNMLCLGSKTPPVDLEVNRMIDRFDVQKEFPKMLPVISYNSHLVSIYYNIHMLWHHFFDFLLPLYQTITLEGSLDMNKLIYFMGFVDKAPEFTSSLTKHKVGYLRSSLCFRKLTMGMVKITDLSQDKDDPPYKFCVNCSSGLRLAIMNNLGITEKFNDEPPTAILLCRDSNIRFLTNPKETAKAISQFLPNLSVSIQFFERTPLKNQVELLSKASIFISVHGSGLANLLWMHHGSVVIEIMPDQFICRDWYKKAANAAGVHYFAYMADGINEKPKYQSEKLKNCLKMANRCVVTECIDSIRDQNVTIDPSKFVREVKNYLKTIGKL